MEKFLSVAIILIIVPIVVPLIGKIFTKFGIKKITDRELAALKKEKFPPSYPVGYMLLVVADIILFIVLLITSIFLFIKASYLLFDNNSLFFSADKTAPFITSFIVAFGLTFFLGGFLSLFTWNVASSKLKKYLQREQALKMGSDYLGSSVALVIIGLLILSISAPIAYLSLHNYKSIYPDKIIANSLLNPKDRIYSLNDVLGIEISSGVKNNNIGSKQIIFLITFKDGYSANFWGDVKKMDKELINNLKDRGIKVSISKPDQAFINYFMSCYGEEYKQYFITLFELENPKYSLINCDSK